MTRKPQSHVGKIVIYLTWAIVVIRIACASLERGASSLNMVITAVPEACPTDGTCRNLHSP